MWHELWHDMWHELWHDMWHENPSSSFSNDCGGFFSENALETIPLKAESSLSFSYI
jgi:hypothetical protein